MLTYLFIFYIKRARRYQKFFIYGTEFLSSILFLFKNLFLGIILKYKTVKNVFLQVLKNA